MVPTASRQLRSSSSFRAWEKWVLGAAISISLFAVLLTLFVPVTPELRNERLDSVIAELGSLLLLLMGMVLFLMGPRSETSSRASLASGLLLVGGLRLLDSTTEHEISTLWLRRFEMFSIGFLFAGCWEKTSLIASARIRRWLARLAIPLMLSGAALVYLAPDWLPPVAEPHHWLRFDNLLCWAGGVMALVSVGVFLSRFGRAVAADEFVMLYVCLAYGLLGICLPLTPPWHLGWWVLQATQLGPFIVALWFVFSIFRGLQDEVESTSRQLRASNEDLENFAYIASHDLQEPLRMVSSYLSLLSRRYTGKLDKNADDFIAFALDGAMRMKQLIHDLLEFSRLGRGDLKSESVDLNDGVKRAVRNLELLIKETNAEVAAPALPSVVGMKNQLVQLFQNLLANAIKFRRDEPPKIRITSEYRPAQRDWLFSVSDNGIGFDPAESSRIFQLFQRLHGKTQYPGSGIGLSTCRRIVEGHGGRIWADSAVGRGSVFYFTLRDGAET